MRIALFVVAILALPALAFAQADVKRTLPESGLKRPGAIQGARTVDRKLNVDWSKVQEKRRQQTATQAPQALRNVRAAELDETHVPVLLPNNADVRARARVFPRPDSYAASVNLSGALIEIFGTRIAKEAPAGATAQLSRRMKMTSGGYLAQRTETGIELSFERYGVSYNIAVTCDDPTMDERCTKSDFIIGFADAMDVFGGTPEGGEQ